MAHHLVRAQELLEQFQLQAVFCTSPQDVLYCTGLRLSNGVVLVTKDRAFVCTDARYVLTAQQLPNSFTTIVSSSMTALTPFCTSIQGPIGFDPNAVTFSKYQQYLKMAPQLEAAPLYFQMLRRQKDPEELRALERACQLCDQGLVHLLSHVRPGVTEKALSCILKKYWFEHGADSLSFEPIIAFGIHSACPHWTTSHTILSKGDCILIDIGVCVDMYHSDMTRMAFFGTPDEELLRCYGMIQQAYLNVVSAIKPGILPYQLDMMARGYLQTQGYLDYFNHGLGHGVGLVVHEAPRISSNAPSESALLQGDVFTIEPGIYLPNKGGVRVENMVVVEQESARSLSELPTDAILL